MDNQTTYCTSTRTKLSLGGDDGKLFYMGRFTTSKWKQSRLYLQLAIRTYVHANRQWVITSSSVSPRLLLYIIAARGQERRERIHRSRKHPFQTRPSGSSDFLYFERSEGAAGREEAAPRGGFGIGPPRPPPPPQLLPGGGVNHGGGGGYVHVLPRRAAVHAAEQLPHDVHVVVLARSDLPAQLAKTGGSTEAEAPAEAEPDPLYRHGGAAKAGVRHAASLISARAL